MKSIATVVSTVLLLNSFTSALSSAPQTEPSAREAVIQAEVRSLGVGEKKHVKVLLQDGSEAKGYISKIGDSSFEVTDPKTGTRKSIAYVDAKRVRRSGISTGAKIGIVVGAVVLVVLIAYAAALSGLGSNLGG